MQVYGRRVTVVNESRRGLGVDRAPNTPLNQHPQCPRLLHDETRWCHTLSEHKYKCKTPPPENKQ